MASLREDIRAARNRADTASRRAAQRVRRTIVQRDRATGDLRIVLEGQAQQEHADCLAAHKLVALLSQAIALADHLDVAGL